MLENNYGRVVTLGSRGAVQPTGQLAAYCASKAGMVALTQAITDETKGTPITANVVLPSVIDTPAIGPLWVKRMPINGLNLSPWPRLFSGLYGCSGYPWGCNSC